MAGIVKDSTTLPPTRNVTSGTSDAHVNLGIEVSARYVALEHPSYEVAESGRFQAERSCVR